MEVGSALILVRQKFALAGARGKVFHLRRDGGKRLGFGLANHRREEAAFDGYRDSNIGVFEAQDGVFGPYRVGGGHSLERQCQTP